MKVYYIDERDLHEEPQDSYSVPVVYSFVAQKEVEKWKTLYEDLKDELTKNTMDYNFE